jgi:hypothetical protein
MARPSLYRRQQYGTASQQEVINGADLDTPTLQAGEYVTIWSATVPADQIYHWGYGPQDREFAEAFAYCDLLADGTGALNDDETISGTLRFAITDSTGDDIARKNFGDLDNLSDAEADDRTDRPVNPELAPAASEDKNLELQVKVASADDGAVVATDSLVKLYYGVFSGVAGRL